MNYEEFYTAFLRLLNNFGNEQGITHKQIAGECDRECSINCVRFKNIILLR